MSETVLFQTIQGSISTVFYLHILNLKTVLFQTIQLSISTLFSAIWHINKDPVWCHHSGSEWNWVRWQWRDTPHSLKFNHYWILAIILFSVLSRTLVGEVLPLNREAVGVFYSPCRLGWLFSIMSGTLMGWGWGVLPIYKEKNCILTSQPSGLRLFNVISRTLVGGVSPLSRYAVDVFCNPSRLGWDGLISYLGHSLVESYSSSEMQSVYSAAPADLASF